MKSLDLAIIELERVQNSARPGASAMLMALPFEADPFKGKEPSRLTIEESRTLVEDEGLGRKALERIAIERFAVPKGSMRSYPTIGALREKLMTLIRNDFAHHTIANVSRGG